MSVWIYVVEALILLLAAFSAYHSYYSWKTGVPTISTSKGVRLRMVAAVPQGARRIVEMGSGWGGLAIAVAKARPDCEVTAIEYSVLPYLVSRVRGRRLKNISFRRGDFFDFSLRGTDIVLCYLLVPMLERLRLKFLAELPDHALIISNTYPIPDWTPERVDLLDGFFEKDVLLYRKSGAKAA